MFTDGYADQFGGEHSKKIMTKRLKEIFMEKKDIAMQEQHNFLAEFFTSWKSGNEQVDDVLVLGLRI